MVASVASENSPLTNLRTRHDFPTPDSPGEREGGREGGREKKKGRRRGKERGRGRGLGSRL